MKISSQKLGHKIYWDDNEWRYQDSGESINSPRLCKFCSKPSTNAGHDACIENLPGVKNACCGHGSTQDAYVQFGDRTYRKEEAIDYFIREKVLDEHVNGMFFSLKDISKILGDCQSCTNINSPYYKKWISEICQELDTLLNKSKDILQSQLDQIKTSVFYIPTDIDEIVDSHSHIKDVNFKTVVKIILSNCKPMLPLGGCYEISSEDSNCVTVKWYFEDEEEIWNIYCTERKWPYIEVKVIKDSTMIFDLHTLLDYFTTLRK